MKYSDVKLRAGKFLIPARIESDDKRLYFNFGFNKTLLEEIKMMEGRKYHGFDELNPRKIWSVPITQRNSFQLQYLLGGDPYKAYDVPLLSVTTERPLREHQKEMKAFIKTRHYCIVAGEMGVGKTLAMEEVIEDSGSDNWIWVAPRSALRSVELELEKWQCKIKPRLYTYEGMKKLIADWQSGKQAPLGVVFDESQRLKNCTSQRYQAAKHLADSIREEHKEKGFVVLMTGTPAPKSPADWWSQCEIACPGFLKEGDIHKFRERLGVIVQKENAPGAGVYPHLITWRDDENKCNECGELKEHVNHDPDGLAFGVHGAHPFKPSKNEVLNLYSRMKGLVLVKRKKDCISLPEKQYQIIRLKPSQSLLNAAKLIKSRAKTAITALSLLRELSDGFQYSKIESGTQECPLCKGSKVHYDWYDPARPDEIIEQEFEGLIKRTIACPHCDGVGEIAQYSRSTNRVPCPKDDALKDLLDQHLDVGRFVVYGGFEGTVDRIIDIVTEQKWHYICADGRGWRNSFNANANDSLKAFQYDKQLENICFIGQAGAAGTGLTLTASPGILYFSNCFDGEARMQSEDRIHRLGMDENRGATIYDLFHLPSDELVYDNLKKKRKLQDLSLGELDNIFDERQF